MTETIMILADNSEDAINGDYAPSRWEQQIDAIGLLLNSKFQGGQNAAGLATMAGKAIDVLCTPSKDGTKVAATLYGVKLQGHINLKNALSVSMLALKNRQNEKSAQKILLFVGSKISETVEELKLIGRKLAKNNIYLTVMAFGEIGQEQREKIDALTDKGSSQNQVYWVEKDRVIADTLISTSVFGSGGGDFPAPTGASSAGGAGGVAPNLAEMEAMDPEMAEAIRLSLIAHQEDEKKNAVANAQSKKEDKMQVEKDKIAEISAEQLEAEKLAQELNEREAKNDAENMGKMETEDDGKEKQKKKADAQTIASQRIAPSEIANNENTIGDFLTEKAGGTMRTRKEDFDKKWDKMDEQEQEEEEGKDGKKSGKKAHQTEKYKPKKPDAQ